MIFLKNKFSFILFILLFPTQVFSLDLSESTLNTIDQWIEINRDEGRIPGLALAITKKGELAFSEFRGVSNPDGDPVDGNTQFYIGSLTKAFTTVAILQLVESGVIDLDESVGTYLPDRLDGPASRITLLQLLSQSGGIGAKEGLHFAPSLSERHFSSWDIYTRLEQDHAKSNQFEYSNMNYNLLGLVVEKMGGLMYESYVNKHIIEPLGMNRTVASPVEALNLSKGYRLWFNKPSYLTVRHYANYLPAMGYISCLEDLLIFTDFLLSRNSGTGDSILSEKLRVTMFLPVVESSFCGIDGMYALGWQNGNMGSIKINMIQGGTQGSHNYIYLLPEEQVGIILLTNMNSIFQTDHTENLIPGIIKILDGEKPLRIEADSRTGILYLSFLLFFVISILLTLKGSFSIHVLFSVFIISLMFLILPNFWNITLSAMRMVRYDLYLLMMAETVLLLFTLLIHGYVTFKRKKVE